MDYKKGKLYVGGGQTVVMCTGPGKRNSEFSGVVVKSNNTEFPLAAISNTWVMKSFKEYNGTVNLNNLDWKEPRKHGDVQG